MPTSNRSVSCPWSKRVSLISRTAVYGPVRTVVWEGRSREAPPYPDQDFLSDIDKGTLPQVVFYKPTGKFNQHPSYTDLMSGDAHIADLLERLKRSPQWNNMVVVVTYDENGGFWDHVAPPSGPGWGDRFGPGSRIPALIISPFAKRGFIDKTAYDTTSILKLITARFALEPLPGLREKMGDLSAALNLP